MNPSQSLFDRIPALLKNALLGLFGVGSMILLLAWLAGAFTVKIQPREREALPPPPADLATLVVEAVEVQVIREVAGSIAAEHETSVASQLLGRVAAVHVSAGERVTQGQLILELDEAEHRSRLEQASALLRQAEDHLRRIEQQHQAQAATDAQAVEAKTSQEAARARFEEAQTFLAKCKITAPTAGVLIERLCEVGDTVTPGRTLARLYDHLQLRATVPESLQPYLHVGDVVGVRVDALGPSECLGAITEIVPQAQALSRAFEVKVTGPCPAGLIPGMFGRLRIPLGTRKELRIPLAAIRRVGQVSLVLRVLPDGRLLRQFVQTGEETGDQVLITSGLEPGDRIVSEAARVLLPGALR